MSLADLEDPVAIQTYPSEPAAQIAASALRAEGIAYEVVSDDAGGAYPSLRIAHGVSVVVAAADRYRASLVLGEFEPATMSRHADRSTLPGRVPARVWILAVLAAALLVYVVMRAAGLGGCG